VSKELRLVRDETLACKLQSWHRGYEGYDEMRQRNEIKDSSGEHESTSREDMSSPPLAEEKSYY
jgi:hypothetical protein